MICCHGDCPTTKLCTKLVWLASTDAVLHPEYAQLLEETRGRLAELLPCSGNEECLLRHLFPEAHNQTLYKVFLRKVLSNPQTSDQLVRRVLCIAVADLGNERVLDAVTELVADGRELAVLEAMNAALLSRQ